MNLFKLHFHSPYRTDIIINAGFRKNNLPDGTYSDIVRGELLICSCEAKFVELPDGRLMELTDEGQLSQYNRASNN